jgi:hypothetical protein
MMLESDGGMSLTLQHREVQSGGEQTPRCSHLCASPKGTVQSAEEYDTEQNIRNQSKGWDLRAEVLDRQMMELSVCDGNSRGSREPNADAVSAGDAPGRVQSDEKRRSRNKQNGQDLRVAVLNRNLIKLVMSNGNTGVTREPNRFAGSAEVSDWARDADNYLRLLFLSRRAKCNYRIWRRCLSKTKHPEAP